jgi:hypothetical protein
MKNNPTEWIARLLIGIVVFFNLDAAFSFMFLPVLYSPGFELSGIPGQVIVQGMGLLFLMWNVPYLIALVKPSRFFISLIEAVIMQALGVFGETILLLSLPEIHPTIQSTTVRFISFDGGGLVLLVCALLLAWKIRKKQGPKSLAE